MFGKLKYLIFVLACLCFVSGCSGGSRGTNISSSGEVRSASTGEAILEGSITNLLNGISVLIENGMFSDLKLEPNVDNPIQVSSNGKTTELIIIAGESNLRLLILETDTGHEIELAVEDDGAGESFASSSSPKKDSKPQEQTEETQSEEDNKTKKPKRPKPQASPEEELDEEEASSEPEDTPGEISLRLTAQAEECDVLMDQVQADPVNNPLSLRCLNVMENCANDSYCMESEAYNSSKRAYDNSLQRFRDQCGKHPCNRACVKVVLANNRMNQWVVWATENMEKAGCPIESFESGEEPKRDPDADQKEKELEEEEQKESENTGERPSKSDELDSSADSKRPENTAQEVSSERPSRR